MPIRSRRDFVLGATVHVEMPNDKHSIGVVEGGDDASGYFVDVAGKKRTIAARLLHPSSGSDTPTTANRPSAHLRHDAGMLRAALSSGRAGDAEAERLRDLEVAIECKDVLAKALKIEVPSNPTVRQLQSAAERVRRALDKANTANWGKTPEAVTLRERLARMEAGVASFSMMTAAVRQSAAVNLKAAPVNELEELAERIKKANASAQMAGIVQPYELAALRKRTRDIVRAVRARRALMNAIEQPKSVSEAELNEMVDVLPDTGRGTHSSTLTRG